MDKKKTININKKVCFAGLTLMGIIIYGITILSFKSNFLKNISILKNSENSFSFQTELLYQSLANKSENFELPYTSIPPQSPQYPLIAIKEYIARLQKEETALFQAEKRINELVRWGTSLPLKKSNHTEKSNLHFFFRSVTWNEILKKYSQLMITEISNATKKHDAVAQTQKLRLRMNTHYEILIEAVNNSNKSPNEMNQLTTLIDSVFINLFQITQSNMKLSEKLTDYFSLEQLHREREYGFYEIIVRCTNCSSPLLLNVKANKKTQLYHPSRFIYSKTNTYQFLNVQLDSNTESIYLETNEIKKSDSTVSLQYNDATKAYKTTIDSLYNKKPYILRIKNDAKNILQAAFYRNANPDNKITNFILYPGIFSIVPLPEEVSYSKDSRLYLSISSINGKTTDMKPPIIERMPLHNATLAAYKTGCIECAISQPLNFHNSWSQISVKINALSNREVSQLTTKVPNLFTFSIYPSDKNPEMLIINFFPIRNGVIVSMIVLLCIIHSKLTSIRHHIQSQLKHTFSKRSIQLIIIFIWVILFFTDVFFAFLQKTIPHLLIAELLISLLTASTHIQKRLSLYFFALILSIISIIALFLFPLTVSNTLIRWVILLSLTGYFSVESSKKLSIMDHPFINKVALFFQRSNSFSYQFHKLLIQRLSKTKKMLLHCVQKYINLYQSTSLASEKFILILKTITPIIIFCLFGLIFIKINFLLLNRISTTYELYKKNQLYNDRLPVIEHIEPYLVYPGTKVVITGKRFGWIREENNATIITNQDEPDIGIWNDNKIIINVPLRWKPGNVTLYIQKDLQDGWGIGSSNKVSLKVIPINEWSEEDDLFYKQVPSLQPETRKLNGL